MKNLEKLISEKISRRDLMRRAGKASAFLAIGSIIPHEFFVRLSRPSNFQANTVPFFKPIDPSDEDKLVLPEGYEYTVIRKWGDKISENEWYGFNNDFCAYLPIDMPEGGSNSDDGLLFVNHEYPSPVFINNYTEEDFKSGKKKSKEEVEKEMVSVGFSIFRIKREDGEWKFVDDVSYNRRVDANTPILISGKAAGSRLMGEDKFTRGTLANCSGGVTHGEQY